MFKNNIKINIPARDTSTKNNKANWSSFPAIELSSKIFQSQVFLFNHTDCPPVPCPSLYTRPTARTSDHMSSLMDRGRDQFENERKSHSPKNSKVCPKTRL